LYEKKFTIQGAKQHLKIKPDGKKIKPSTISLDEIRMGLKNIRDLIS
jgi:hypothetical protein